MAIDMYRGTSGVQLPASVSSAILDRAETEESLVMRLGSRTEVAPGGTVVQTITNMPEAEFVGETDEKPVGRPGIGSKPMRAYKLALIVPFSNEFKRDLSSLYDALVRKLPASIGKAFDRAVLYGPSPGTGFDTLADAPDMAIDPTTSYEDYLAALTSVVEADGDVTTWALSATAEIAALGAVDGNGRPLFTTGASEGGAVGSILGRPVVRSKVAGDSASGTIGFGGDWETLQWGAVSGIQIAVSDQATITDGATQLNLWQRNMFAVRVEAEMAASVLDADRFVRLTGTTTP